MDFEVWDSRFQLSVAYSLPRKHGNGARRYPILCFLHGDKECEVGAGKGKAIEQAMSVHGPLSTTSAAIAREDFIILCPQLKHPGGDNWIKQCATIFEIVKTIQNTERGDPRRTYLTGFSYGGNGVLAIGGAAGIAWAALWVVDPPSPPNGRPAQPTWISAGPYARRFKALYMNQGYSMRSDNADNSYVYEDAAVDHGGTSIRAYADDGAYRWMLRREIGE